MAPIEVSVDIARPQAEVADVTDPSRLTARAAPDANVAMMVRMNRWPMIDVICCA